MTASVVQRVAAPLPVAAVSIPSPSLTTTTGHGLLCAVVTRSNSGVSGITDGAGNTWAPILNNGATSSARVDVWGTTNANPTGLSGQTIVVTLGSTDTVVAHFFEIAGGNPSA